MSEPSRKRSGGILRSSARIAYDRIRISVPPDDVERELVDKGTRPEEARRLVDGAIQTRYEEKRSRAVNEMLLGGGVFAVGLGLSPATMFSSGAGTMIVLFYGAILGGLAMAYRGWVMLPRRPAPHGK